MRRQTAWAAGQLAAVVVTGLFVVGARADTVLELEGSAGPQSNGTYLTAQALAPALFTPNTDPNVAVADPTATVLGYGNGSDVDFYSFAVAGPGEVALDIDNSTIDTIVALFDGGGSLITQNDDGGVLDPGSFTAFNSALSFVLPTAGTYFVAVSQWSNFANNDGTYQFGVSSTGGTESYQLHISLSNPAAPAPPVPLPGVAWAGAALLGGLGVARFRRGGGRAHPSNL